MRNLSDAAFGCCTFVAQNDATDKVGCNGLPLVPPSINVVGLFQWLKSLDCAFLAAYLDVVRGRHDHMFVVTEHYAKSAEEYLARRNGTKLDLLKIAWQVLVGLKYLHNRNVTHGFLCPKHILLNSKGDVRLTHYGLSYMSSNGRDLPFPIGQCNYMAPEVLCGGSAAVTSASDIWSLGLIVLELSLGRHLWTAHDPGTFVEMMLKMCREAQADFDGCVLEPILADIQVSASSLPDEVEQLARSCLMVLPSARATTGQLLSCAFFHDRCFNGCNSDICASLGLECVFTAGANRTTALTPEALAAVREDAAIDLLDNPLTYRPIDEVYNLWKLAGSDVECIMEFKGHVKHTPAVLALPDVVVDDFDMFGRESDRITLTDLSIVPLSMKNLFERTKTVEAELFFPILELKYLQNLPTGGNDFDQAYIESAKLPTVIKERDIEYQLHRQILFERLVNAYPFKKTWCWREARVDIPPLYRRYVWAALLDVHGDIVGAYDRLDKDTPTPTDRQLEVDIPRCHQYDELMSSPAGHARMKRVLKAWIICNPQYVYWQGLDSLCAPFLHLNFNNEALAFACLSAFIPKYLHNFFWKDNSAVIHEYLAIFAHLIAYHDPRLYLHLTDIGFLPELYAIPWFLTMFAHVFPLHKIFHLWDTLLLGSHSFPLCVGVAVLLQLRDALLQAGFNECILLFSDLPEIDIEKCVEDSVRLFCNTPRSATVRQHSPPSSVTMTQRERKTSASFVGYTVDTTSQLGMNPLSLAELRSDPCTRICAQEVLELTGIAKGQSGTEGKSKVLVVDIRKEDEFAKGTYPGAVNVPSILKDKLGQAQNVAVARLRGHRGKMIVVMGSKAASASDFASELLKLGYARVCILHKGIDVFRYTDVLTVPPVQFERSA